MFPPESCHDADDDDHHHHHGDDVDYDNDDYDDDCLATSICVYHKTHLGDDVRTVILHLRTAFVIVQKFKLNIIMTIMMIPNIMIMMNTMISIVIMITCEEGEACVDPPTILLRTTATTAIVITTSTYE